MPAKKKPTLADRRRAARETLTPEDPGTPPPAPSPDNAPSTDSSASTISTAPAPSADTAPSAPGMASTISAASASSAVGTGTISVSLTNQQLRDAKAAFLADWEHGGPETFAAWTEQALRAHAARTPTQRATNMVTASGQTRSFRVSDDTRALVEAAVADDCAAGHWVSLSTWAATAITTATDAARQHGPLPTPPERLPGRLPARRRMIPDDGPGSDEPFLSDPASTVKREREG